MSLVPPATPTVARPTPAPARRAGLRATSLVLTLALAGSLAACSDAGNAAAPAPPATVPSAPAATDPTGSAAVGSLALGTKAPYAPFAEPSSHQAVPEGFTPVLVEHVGRHGSRLLSSKKYDDLLAQLWDIADEADGLTALGRELGPDIDAITAVHEQIGYGSLSGRGATEHVEIAQRTHARLQPLFAAAAQTGQPVTITTSGVDRAVESGQSFVDGLLAAQPDLAAVVADTVVDADLLYFHDTDAAYLAYEDGDERLEEALDAIEEDDEISAVAAHVVAALFTPEFVDRIEAGEIDLVDRGKGETHLESVTDVAAYLYELYVIAPGMSAELDVDLSPYLSAADATVLASLSDAEDFYEKGPGFAGEDVTYRMADVLLDSFLTAVEGVRTGATTQAADFRFAHAEEIIPFAALLELPGSTEQVAEGTRFDYTTNPWRGAEVAPMSANIQWDVFRDDAGEVLVRMLYNERETAFAFDCTPVAEGSFFYTDTELTRCLAGARNG